jgi:hypothetical protein
MTATADRFEPGRSREELRLVEVASGLLMLLDAHRLTGRLPLEVQVQTSRLRHAVKQVVQAEAVRTATLPPTPPSAASPDQAAALRTWIASQPWVQPGPVGWVYLLCLRDPATGQHRPLQGKGCRVSTPATTGAGPTTWSAASASTATPAGVGPAGWSGRPGRRADLRAGLAGIPGHPGPGAAAQEPGLGLSALPAVPRHRRPPRPRRGRRRHPTPSPLPQPRPAGRR